MSMIFNGVKIEPDDSGRITVINGNIVEGKIVPSDIKTFCTWCGRPCSPLYKCLEHTPPANFCNRDCYEAHKFTEQAEKIERRTQ